MKTASTGLISMLNSNDEVYIADLYTFTLNDGTIIKYTNSDVDIGAYSSSDILTLSRNGIKIVKGIKVDTMSLHITYAPSSTFMRSLQNGSFDGARVLIERAIMTTYGDISNGTVVMFSGRVSNAEFDRTMADIEVKSDFELLNIQMPRNLYQPSCSYALYSTGCGAVKATFTKSYTITSTSTSSIFNTDVAEASDVYSQGIIVFTSGVNAGVKRTVKYQTNGTVAISLPLAYTPNIGDTFDISQGCDKTKTTCETKFNNIANFRGFPYVPKPETAR